MKKRYRLIASVIAGLFGLSTIALVILQHKLSGSIEERVQITRNIGEIERLDEVLTMSAMMFSSSRNQQFRDRYQQNVLVLEKTINDLLRLSRSEEALSAVQQTEVANQALVALEDEAFHLAEQGKWQEASDRLLSKEYHDKKVLYSAGMRAAFDIARRASDREITVLSRTVLIVACILFLSLLSFLKVWHQAQLYQFELQSSQAKHEALRITMRTVMDTFNNALNSLQLFRLQAEESQHFQPQDLATFDEIVQDAAEKLSAMGNMTEFRVRKENSHFLDYEASTEQHTRDEQCVNRDSGA